MATGASSRRNPRPWPHHLRPQPVPDIWFWLTPAQGHFKAVSLFGIQAVTKIPHPHPDHLPSSWDSIRSMQPSWQRDAPSWERKPGLCARAKASSCALSPAPLPPRKATSLQMLRSFSTFDRNLCNQKWSSRSQASCISSRILGKTWFKFVQPKYIIFPKS